MQKTVENQPASTAEGEDKEWGVDADWTAGAQWKIEENEWTPHYIRITGISLTIPAANELSSKVREGSDAIWRKDRVRNKGMVGDLTFRVEINRATGDGKRVLRDTKENINRVLQQMHRDGKVRIHERRT